MKQKKIRIDHKAQYWVSRWFVDRRPGLVNVPMRVSQLAKLICTECQSGIDADLLSRADKIALIQGFYIDQKISPEIPAARKTHEQARDFYNSYEWANARYDAIKRSKGCCEACGMGKKDGVKLNVDHIKPLRLNWELKSDPNNLQVLCELCNKGKGNRDETDWR